MVGFSVTNSGMWSLLLLRGHLHNRHSDVGGPGVRNFGDSDSSFPSAILWGGFCHLLLLQVRPDLVQCGSWGINGERIGLSVHNASGLIPAVAWTPLGLLPVVYASSSSEMNALSSYWRDCSGSPRSGWTFPPSTGDLGSCWEVKFVLSGTSFPDWSPWGAEYPSHWPEKLD